MTKCEKETEGNAQADNGRGHNSSATLGEGLTTMHPMLPLSNIQVRKRIFPCSHWQLHQIMYQTCHNWYMINCHRLPMQFLYNKTFVQWFMQVLMNIEWLIIDTEATPKNAMGKLPRLDYSAKGPWVKDCWEAMGSQTQFRVPLKKGRHGRLILWAELTKSTKEKDLLILFLTSCYSTQQ